MRPLPVNNTPRFGQAASGCPAASVCLGQVCDRRTPAKAIPEDRLAMLLSRFAPLPLHPRHQDRRRQRPEGPRPGTPTSPAAPLWQSASRRLGLAPPHPLASVPAHATAAACRRSCRPRRSTAISNSRSCGTPGTGTCRITTTSARICAAPAATPSVLRMKGFEEFLHCALIRPAAAEKLHRRPVGRPSRRFRRPVRGPGGRFRQGLHRDRGPRRCCRT